MAKDAVYVQWSVGWLLWFPFKCLHLPRLKGDPRVIFISIFYFPSKKGRSCVDDKEAYYGVLLFWGFFGKGWGFWAHFEVLQVVPEWKKIPARKYCLKKVKVFNV